MKKIKKILKDNVPKKDGSPKAWIISVDMGYGHQRAAYPLKDIAFERIFTANKDKVVSEKDRAIWEETRLFYETVSRLKDIPIIGKLTFGVYDQLQSISPFFPFRDQSKPNFSVLRLKGLINHGFGRSLLEYTSKENLPIIATHPFPALSFDYNNRQIYAVVTDTDINRIWVKDNPKTSKMIYFSPCNHVTMRLMQYGVPKEKIIETGFPLPKENIGENDEILKKDLMPRLVNLDPSGVFFDKYRGLVADKLGLKHNQKFDVKSLEKFKTHRLTITYAIGGAGAQKEIAIGILASLKDKIRTNDVIINIVVGVKLELKIYFESAIGKMGLREYLGKNIKIIFQFDKKDLFAETNNILRTTDVLWTKPSEMSFYTALGLPIIIAPPIGAHEQYNREWLEHIGSGFVQEDPKFTKDWLYYWLQDGRLADAAIQGFIDAPRHGTYNIEKYLKQQQGKQNI